MAVPCNYNREQFELLAFGYINSMEKSLQLSMNIENGIKNLVTYFIALPKLFRFDLYHPHKFSLSNDKRVLKGKSNGKNSYLVYAECNDSKNEGFMMGIHYWSIKLHAPSQCCYIGIKSKRVKTWCYEQWGRKPHEGGLYYYVNAALTKSKIFTVKLDCNNWKISYYQGLQVLATTEITANTSYYFVLQARSLDQENYYVDQPDNPQRTYTHFEVVSTPIDII